MWLAQYIAKQEDSRPDRGAVSRGSGGRADFNGSAVHGSLKLVAPYGIIYNPPADCEGVALPCDGSRVIVGVTSGIDPDLEPGELMLFSSGGASIVLKNDGKVYINGRDVTTSGT